MLSISSTSPKKYKNKDIIIFIYLLLGLGILISIFNFNLNSCYASFIIRGCVFDSAGDPINLSAYKPSANITFPYRGNITSQYLPVLEPWWETTDPASCPMYGGYRFWLNLMPGTAYVPPYAILKVIKGDLYGIARPVFLPILTSGRAETVDVYMTRHLPDMPPRIKIIQPQEQIMVGNGILNLEDVGVTFYFNVSDDYNIWKCELFVDNTTTIKYGEELNPINKKNFESTPQTIYGLDFGDHICKVVCEDDYGNVVEKEKKFSIVTKECVDLDAPLTYLGILTKTNNSFYMNRDGMIIKLCKKDYKISLSPGSSDGAIIFNCSNCGIDCDGSTIDGLSDNGNGFYIVPEHRDIIIKNCNIKNYDKAIYIFNGHGVLIDSNTISSSNIAIHIKGTYDKNNRIHIKNNIIGGDNVIDTNGIGIYIDESKNVIIEGNYLFNNNYGVVLGGDYYNLEASSDYARSDNNRVISNVINDHNSYGILVYGDDNLIFYNELDHNKNGIKIKGQNNELFSNKITSSYDKGVEIIGNSNFLHELTINNSGITGLYITQNSHNNLISNLRSCGNVKWDVVDDYYNSEDYDKEYANIFNGTIECVNDLPKTKICNKNCYEGCIDLDDPSKYQGKIELGPNGEFIIKQSLTLCKKLYSIDSFYSDITYIPAITIDCDNCYLDCGDAIIDGVDGDGIGIYTNRLGVRVLNCNVRNYDYGIKTNSVELTGSRFCNNTEYDVYSLLDIDVKGTACDRVHNVEGCLECFPKPPSNFSVTINTDNCLGSTVSIYVSYNNTPIPDANVTIYKKSHNRYIIDERTHTDTQGSVYFTLNEEKYKVVITKQGYNSYVSYISAHKCCTPKLQCSGLTTVVQILKDCSRKITYCKPGEKCVDGRCIKEQPPTVSPTQTQSPTQPTPTKTPVYEHGFFKCKDNHTRVYINKYDEQEFEEKCGADRVCKDGKCVSIETHKPYPYTNVSTCHRDGQLLLIILALISIIFEIIYIVIQSKHTQHNQLYLTSVRTKVQKYKTAKNATNTMNANITKVGDMRLVYWILAVVIAIITVIAMFIPNTGSCTWFSKNIFYLLMAVIIIIDIISFAYFYSNTKHTANKRAVQPRTKSFVYGSVPSYGMQQRQTQQMQSSSVARARTAGIGNAHMAGIKSIKRLDDYIIMALLNNTPIENIKRNLVNVGWKQHIVDRELDKVVKRIQQLVGYIRKAREKGMKDTMIKQALLKVGWNPVIVDKVLSSNKRTRTR